MRSFEVHIRPVVGDFRTVEVIQFEDIEEALEFAKGAAPAGVWMVDLVARFDSRSFILRSWEHGE